MKENGEFNQEHSAGKESMNENIENVKKTAAKGYRELAALYQTMAKSGSSQETGILNELAEAHRDIAEHYEGRARLSEDQVELTNMRIDSLTRNLEELRK